LLQAPGERAIISVVSSIYNDGNRRLQDRFDTRRLADRLEQKFLSEVRFDERERAFIEGLDMFFIATADADGLPTCSYKGGEPGFVRVVDEQTLAFPNFDGNGMYLTAGNVLDNAHVGLLFISFEEQKRLRVEGIASVSEDDELIAAFPGAQFVTRVRATRIYPNCPRYIHHYALVSRSRFVPGGGCEVPVPAWKRQDWAADVLPAGDPAESPDAEVIHRG
jgi:predicted pyridoxine 5'-phosphate oxidase superfamily flavin-nucleotide-binding protein